MQLDFAVREANYLKADSLYRRLPPPRFDTLQYPTLQAFKTNDVAKQEALYRAYEQDTTIPAGWISYRILHEREDMDGALRFAQLALREKAPGQPGERAPIWMAMLESERGQIHSSIERIRTSSVRDKAQLYLEWTSSPFYRISAKDLAMMRAETEAWDSIPQNQETAEQVRPHIKLYRLAVLSCRAADYAAAAQFAQRMRTMPAPAALQPSIALLADEIDAQIDVENGRPLEAIRRLEARRNTIATDIGRRGLWGSGAAVWRAEALYRAGKYEEAQKWFDNLDETLVNDQPHIAYILLRRAQIADARNDAATARDLYARFLKIFSQPDQEMKAEVDQARARLNALQQQAG